eukprot:scaffold3405_cov127-Cylindrotheca_fusiformis.AAC.7
MAETRLQKKGPSLLRQRTLMCDWVMSMFVAFGGVYPRAVYTHNVCTSHVSMPDGRKRPFYT